MIRRRLAESNPWWASAAGAGDPTAWVAHDLLLLAKARFDVGYRSTLLDDLATAPIGDTMAVL